jgi:hypothetical protein
VFEQHRTCTLLSHLWYPRGIVKSLARISTYPLHAQLESTPIRWIVCCMLQHIVYCTDVYTCCMSKNELLFVGTTGYMHTLPTTTFTVHALDNYIMYITYTTVTSLDEK